MFYFSQEINQKLGDKKGRKWACNTVNNSKIDFKP